jgi:hypothetical protein
MPKYCPYCGATVKDKDRFCVVCGKPMLTNLPKSDKSKKEDPETNEEDTDSEEDEKDKGKKKSKKEEQTKKKEQPEIKIVHLPPEAKEYYDIKMKKKVLINKLNGYSKEMKGTRYETDYEFSERIRVQIKAAQTLIADIKQKEADLLATLDDKYLMKKLTQGVSEKRSQLKNLTQQYKLHKVKKDVFNNLKETYKSELMILEADQNDLILGLNTWKTELGTEKVKLQNEQKILEGRFKAKEITDKDEFNEKHNGYSTRIKNLEIKVQTIENVLKNKE